MLLEELVVGQMSVVMMFRAMSWWRCHWRMEGNDIVADQSRFSACQMPRDARAMEADACGLVG